VLTEALPESKRDLTELITLLGSSDEIAPVDDFGFAKKAGEIIARTRADIRRRYTANRERTANKDQDQRVLRVDC